MERDARIRRGVEEYGYKALPVDGKKRIDEHTSFIDVAFGLAGNRHGKKPLYRGFLYFQNTLCFFR
jgi:hypothetical protein